MDVSLNLRWPTARETSGPWVRALAAARPTVVTDLAHQTHVPALNPRTWELHAPAPRERQRVEGAADAVTVAIDLDDEEHSLRAAMHRLATDRALRERLGREARRYWEAEHTVDRMVADYERLIARAAAQPARHPALPPALRPAFWRGVLDGIGDFAPGVVVE